MMAARRALQARVTAPAPLQRTAWRTPRSLLLCSASPPAPTPTRARARAGARLGPAFLWPVAAPRRCFSAAGDGQQVPGIRAWTFEEVRQQVEAKGTEDGAQTKLVIVDVREPGELHLTGKIPGAINIPIKSAVQSFHIPHEDFEAMYGFARPPCDVTLLFYCKAGVRARSAAGLARHAGWEVAEYPGSWLDWEARGGPVEKVSGGQELAAGCL